MKKFIAFLGSTVAISFLFPRVHFTILLMSCVWSLFRTNLFADIVPWEYWQKSGNYVRKRKKAYFIPRLFFRALNIHWLSVVVHKSTVGCFATHSPILVSEARVIAVADSGELGRFSGFQFESHPAKLVKKDFWWPPADRHDCPLVYHNEAIHTVPFRLKIIGSLSPLSQAVFSVVLISRDVPGRL